MKKLIIVCALVVFTGFFAVSSGVPVKAAAGEDFKLGNERLMGEYYYLVRGKKVGLVTNQSGVNSKGDSTIDILARDNNVQLTALFGPEHGIDGKATAGEYVKSYTHPELGIPVYSLYGETRMPTADMLSNVDVLVYDIQDIGARTYTYISTLNYCMNAAERYGKTVVVLDRPNPVGGTVVDGPVLEDRFKTFVGVDNLPMAHGMTAGELSKYFNRNIGVDLKVVPMQGYTREMIWQDTGLDWVQTSPNIPDIDSVFGYMATGLGEGTGVFQADKFKWIGGSGIDAKEYAELMNDAKLPGVKFTADPRGSAGGVRLDIVNPHIFNPAKTGIYALSYAFSLGDFTAPTSHSTIVMFDKIMGTASIGRSLNQGLVPQEIEESYASELKDFKNERVKYLIYGYGSDSMNHVIIRVNGRNIDFDSLPFIDDKNRLMVPLRFIGEGLGANVHWDAEEKQVHVSKKDRKVLLTIGDSTVLVDGEERAMDTVPVIKNSRTMVPARFVSEFLDASVTWYSHLKLVEIELN